MAVASSSSSTSVIFGGFSSSSSLQTHKIHHQFLGKSRPLLSFPRLSFPPLTKTLTFSLRKNNKSAVTTSKKNKKKKKKSLPKNESIEDGDIDEDAIEALFNQLEEDLRNDPSIGDGDDELSEEELARLEKELEEALGDDDELLAMLESSADSLEDDDEGDNEEEEEDDKDDDSEDDEEEKPLDLKNWQIRRLASALKVGRRKTSIKSLAAELGLERALVLELLRDPPPKLLMISTALPDIVVPTTSQSEPESKEPSIETTIDVTEPSTELTEDATEPESTVKGPIHEMQSRWSAQKRLKKVQIETLERVYSRSKRPTNAMVSSIVHVTNLPRKRVVKWFEDKREEDGVVSNQRLPYQRSAPDTVFTS